MSHPVKIRIATPGNKELRTLTFATGKKASVEDILGGVAIAIEKEWPLDKFNRRKIAEYEYQFDWVSATQIHEDELRVGGLPLGEVETVQVGQ